MYAKLNYMLEVFKIIQIGLDTALIYFVYLLVKNKNNTYTYTKESLSEIKERLELESQIKVREFAQMEQIEINNFKAKKDAELMFLNERKQNNL